MNLILKPHRKTIAIRIAVIIVAAIWAFGGSPANASEAPYSAATEGCLACHESATPGIVADWKNSAHAKTVPAEALTRPDEERRVSVDKVPEELAGVAVGCAECHSLNPDSHPDTFDHEGESVHTVVSPADCSTCHAVEAEQFDQNKMSRAHGILKNNPWYMGLVKAVVGDPVLEKGGITSKEPGDMMQADSCFHCHGTKVEVTGTETRETSLGEMDFPVLAGWPSQGVGRINPDGSRGSCAACHTRHLFSVKTARQPYTCSQCHKGPDVPAYKIYQVSKHGNLFASHKEKWDWEAIPWVAGRDFTAPTCATCHISLVMDPEGTTLAERTHRMNDRLPFRLFGLVYSHPQPKDPDTSKIINKAGYHLPTELNGEPVSEFLIDKEEIAERTKTMQTTCLACHSRGWVDGHWTRLEKSILSSDQSVKVATHIMTTAWEKGLADLDPKNTVTRFDEPIERQWVEHWLFFANSVRLATAMGGADYGVFDGGRWDLSKNLSEMARWLEKNSKTDKNK